MQGQQISPDRLKRVIESFRNTSLIVVGDVMVDEYLWGDVKRISPRRLFLLWRLNRSAAGCGGQCGSEPFQSWDKAGVGIGFGNDENGCI